MVRVRSGQVGLGLALGFKVRVGMGKKCNANKVR